MEYLKKNPETKVISKVLYCERYKQESYGIVVLGLKL